MKPSCAALFFSLLLPLMFSCERERQPLSYDFPQIVEKDTLDVLTLNTSISYFIYRDQPMGYHYDLIKNFADRHQLYLNIIVAPTPSALTRMLLDSVGDVVAYYLPVDARLKDSILYCGLQDITHQVLVQRSEKNDTILRDVSRLINKDVYVLQGSKYDERIRNLNEELGGGIHTQYVDEDTLVLEDLIRIVSRGEIKYTVADELNARINKTYFQNIDVTLPISFDQRMAWAVRKNTPILADSLNAWVSQAANKPAYQRVTKRYFEEAKGYSSGSKTFVALIASGHISPYDAYFKQYGKEYGIDWRLLASVSYHESTFNPDGESWAGAGGLMGLMPATAASLGIKGADLFHEESNIRAGTQYLRNLLNSFGSVENEEERIKMALGAYNGGIAHIVDARALAEKYGADKNVWDGNVEKYVLLKRLEQYYNDAVCKAGYFRGDETADYVQNVTARWMAYREKVK